MTNKDHIQLWIDGLLSGEYGQARDTLRNDTNDLCCLGVATEVAIKAGVAVYWNDEEEVYCWEDEDGVENQDDAVLPHPVKQWLGLSDSNPIIAVSESGEDVDAIDGNDKLGLTFEQIADCVRYRYLS